MQLQLGTRSVGREALPLCQESRALKGKFPEVWTYIATAVTFLEGVLTTRSHHSENESFAGPLPFPLWKSKTT